MSTSLTIDAIQPRVTHMTVEVTTQCSLKCVGCARTLGQEAGVWQDRHMSAALFARIVPNLPRLQKLTMHGIGEPTLNPEYVEMVAIAAKSGRFKAISANTHALSRPIAYYRRLADAGLTRLVVSVDSLTQEVADRTRTGTNVARLRRRLDELASLPIPVAITMVASRFNLEDLPITLDALNGAGQFAVQLQSFLDLGRPEGCLTPADLAQIQRLVAAGSSRWPQLAITPILGFAASQPGICDAPWSSLAVTVDGFLTPCCIMWDPAALGFINIGDMSVDAAFTTPSFRAFLERYLQQAPPFCAACPVNTRPVQDVFIPLQRHPASGQLAMAG